MLFILLGVAIWSLRLVSLLSSMLIISSALPAVLILFWLLLGTLSLMSILSVKRPLLESAYCSAHPRPLVVVMTAWRNEHEGCFWAVKLDVRDLGGHLDVTLRAVAGTLSSRVRIATTQVPAVGALTLGFQRMLGMVRSKYLPGGLHGCEGAAVSVTALSSFRSAIARAVWSKKIPMTNTPALLSLLDGPWDDEARIFRLLDCASTGSTGHGPIHLLIQPADEIGFFLGL